MAKSVTKETYDIAGYVGARIFFSWMPFLMTNCIKYW